MLIDQERVIEEPRATPIGLCTCEVCLFTLSFLCACYPFRVRVLWYLSLTTIALFGVWSNKLVTFVCCAHNVRPFPLFGIKGKLIIRIRYLCLEMLGCVRHPFLSPCLCIAAIPLLPVYLYRPAASQLADDSQMCNE